MVSAQLVILGGELVERQHAAADRIAGRVVTTDDQQDEVAQVLLRRHPLGVLAVGHHRDQIAGRRQLDPLVPEPGEVIQALHQLGLASLFGLADSAGHRQAGGDVRPSGQLAPFLEGEIKEGGQHLGRQLDGDLVDPVKLLADRQRIEDRRRPLANDRLQVLQIGRRDYRADGLSLHVVARRIHGDEARPAQVGARVADGDAAQRRVRRKHLIIGVDGHDVLVAGHRPIGPELAVVAPVHRRLAPQAFEVGPEAVGQEQVRITGVKIFQRHRVGIGPRLVPECARIVGHGRIPLLSRLYQTPNRPAPQS